MGVRRKPLVIAGAIVALMLVALLVLPLLFEGRAEAAARTALGRAVDAQVDWSGARLTLLRHFPNLTLSVEDLAVVGRRRFEGDTLVTAGSLRFVLDLASVVRAWRKRGPVVVRSIRVDRPALRLAVLKDGTANWSIASHAPASGGGSGAAAASRAVDVELRSFEISGGTVTFDNQRSGLSVEIAGLRCSLGGNLAQQHVVVKTDAHADRVSARLGGVPYLDGAALDFRADVDADLAAKKFTFRDNELRVNDLAVRFAGDVAQTKGGLAVNVKFSAPRTDFSQAASLVPILYGHDFASLQTSGTFSLEGHVQGTYSQGTLPAFGLEATVRNGMFHYPDLPLPARDISLDLAVDNPGGGLDSTVARLDHFHILIGEHPLDASLTLRTPISDPDIDATVRGTVDLAEVGRTIELKQVQELAGTVSADASLRARLSDVQERRYGRVDARGKVSVRNVTVQSAGLAQPVSVRDATLELTPQRAALDSLVAQIGSSDVRARGQLDNLLGFALRREPLRGSATFASRHVALDEWKSKSSGVEFIPVPSWLDVSLKGTVDTLTYGQLRMTDAHGSLGVKDQKVSLDTFTVRTLGGRMSFTGTYDAHEPSRPAFSMGLTLDSLDVAGAAAAFNTVRALAPVARYARGSFSTHLDLSGVLGHDMSPVLDSLDGKGLLSTSRLAIEGFPPLQKLAGALTMPALGSPTLSAIRSSIEIRDGRLYVHPFAVRVGSVPMSVEGSNGVDQSLDYTLGATVPRAVLGDAAASLMQGLTQSAAKAGLDLKAADSLRLAVKVGGTVTAPSVSVGLDEAATAARQRLESAASAAVESRLGKERARADSAKAEAQRRAQAQADSIVADAERRAAQVRAEAQKLAAQVRAQGEKQADELLAKATNPLARRAAQPVADRIRKEANDKAASIVANADRQADAMVKEARTKADRLTGRTSGGS